MNNEQTKHFARLALGGALIFAGISHWTFARKGFKAQVPNLITKTLPMSKDDVLLASGVAEIALGSAIAFAPAAYRKPVGKVAAAFFTAIFPGNIEQYTEHRSSLGLDTDRKRFVRLFFQPVLVYWALKSTDNV